MNSIDCDVLVIGSGGAGLRAALAARETGADVLVIGRAAAGKGTCTYLSGGVFAGSKVSEGPDDHRRRTLRAGRGINQQDLVDCLVREAPRRLQELIDWGVPGGFHRGYLYVHGRAPVWGKPVVEVLTARNRRLGTRFLEGATVTGLHLSDSGGTVATCRTKPDGRPLRIQAAAVVLAAGGAAALYRRHDNPLQMTGGGAMLALRAGAVLQDMEFVQFYPLALAEPGMPALIVPPGAADKGRLTNNAGEDILVKYGIDERPAAEKARDRLSRALFTEIEHRGRTVCLDLTALSSAAWEADPFSASTRALLGEKYGAFRRPVKVAPIAHHSMGGVSTDHHGATTVAGLYACGEVTGGLHGANRMGGNALTETLVFGARAGRAAARWAGGIAFRPAVPPAQAAAAGKSPPPAQTSRALKPILTRLRQIMWQDGGISRSGEGLDRSLAEIQTLQADLNIVAPADRDGAFIRHQALDEALAAARIVLSAALRRTESRGAHFRSDHPQPDDRRWKGHLQVRMQPDGKLDWSFQRSDTQQP